MFKKKLVYLRVGGREQEPRRIGAVRVWNEG